VEGTSLIPPIIIVESFEPVIGISRNIHRSEAVSAY
jgi:hypothetical protein